MSSDAVFSGTAPSYDETRQPDPVTSYGAVLFADQVRCPVHVTDLASALRELAASPHAGICHVAGTDAISRYELGMLIAARDGLDQTAFPVGLHAATGRPGALDVRLDSTETQARRTARLRGAREFLATTRT